MMDLLPDAIEVHDAVYSKHNINISEVVRHIKQETNFNIKITKEKQQ